MLRFNMTFSYTWYIFCHNNERLPMIGVCGSESALESEY